MHILEIGKALSSNIRCELLMLLGESLSLNEVFHKYIEQGLKKLRKETIYRHLELLVDSGLLEKRYFKNDKRVKYIRTITELRFDLSTGKASLISGDDENDQRK